MAILAKAQCVLLALCVASTLASAVVERFAVPHSAVLDKFQPFIKAYCSTFGQDFGNSSETLNAVYDVIVKTLAVQVDDYLEKAQTFTGEKAVQTGRGPSTLLQQWSGETKAVLVKELRSVVKDRANGYSACPLCCYCETCSNHYISCDMYCCNEGESCHCHMCGARPNTTISMAKVSIPLFLAPKVETALQSVGQLVDQLTTLMAIL